MRAEKRSLRHLQTLPSHFTPGTASPKSSNAWSYCRDLTFPKSAVRINFLPLSIYRLFTTHDMESFERIYLDLSKQAGKCRIAETGLGWKPSGGGDTFTLDASNIASAQWSRAAKGYELKILSRNSGVIQLDGFDQEVRTLHLHR